MPKYTASLVKASPSFSTATRDFRFCGVLDGHDRLGPQLAKAVGESGGAPLYRIALSPVLGAEQAGHLHLIGVGEVLQRRTSR